jgi:hypothetical protein
MTSKRKHEPLHDADLQHLLEKSIREPGVADMIEIYDRAEVVYQRISGAVFYPETAANSTTDALPHGE